MAEMTEKEIKAIEEQMAAEKFIHHRGPYFVHIRGLINALRAERENTKRAREERDAEQQLKLAALGKFEKEEKALDLVITQRLLIENPESCPINTYSEDETFCKEINFVPPDDSGKCTNKMECWTRFFRRQKD